MSGESQEKIVLPKQLQIEMLEFFLRTSIPRLAKLEIEKQREAESSLSEKSDKE
ncbi:MAG: hypothetical protein FWH26_03345 [Oscillospiraceae bacterium]|nr:hypothetical protein [Oscillospiraceae bacterium]